VLQKILVPLDGSALAEAAIDYVKEIARRCEPVEVTLLQVIRMPSGQTAAVSKPVDGEFPGKRAPASTVDADKEAHPIYREQEMASARSSAEASMASAAQALKAADIDTRTQVVFGRPAQEIVDFAEGGDFDLIVMCTHGRSGVQRWLLGSVADKVIRGTHLPVFVVRPRDLDSGA
jgi:nucleotide-binding universal stress UspA family protein